MDKKLSYAVSALAILLILVNAVSVANTFGGDLDYMGPILIGLLVLSNIAMIVCGAFLLNLNEKARKAAIVLCLITLCMVPFWIGVTLKEADYGNKSARVKQVILSKTVTDLTFPTLLYVLVPVIFLTRPKVKALFKS